MSKSLSAVIAITIIFLVVLSFTEGARKPPFNGSIFGKRSYETDNDNREGDYRYRTCEFMYDACNQWFSSRTETQ